MYTKSIPRRRTDEEVEELIMDKQQWLSISEMAEKHNRTSVAINIKLKRIWKKSGSYNKEHLGEKYKANGQFMSIIKPTSVLDLYCWENMRRANNCDCNVYSNDKDENIPCEYHEDAERLITELWLAWDRFDIIDLDPYWSAYDCLDKAIRLADKWLIVTVWELWHKRFKRLDYVRYRYDIYDMEHFTLGNIIKYIQKIWMINKKKLMPVLIKDWNRIWRVYFSIDNIKITEMRDKE